MVLPYLVAQELPGLRFIPSGVKEEWYRRPRWIGGSSHSNINSDSLPIAALYVIHYNQNLDHLIRESVIEYPALGPVYVLKEYVSDGFYQIALRPADVPKLGLVFPFDGQAEDMSEIHSTLPMGWKNSPPILCTSKETVIDLVNSYLR